MLAIFGINSVIVLKVENNEETTIKKIKNQNEILRWWDYRFSYWKIPEIGSNYACWLVILIVSVLLKRSKLLHESVFKRNPHLKRTKRD